MIILRLRTNADWPSQAFARTLRMSNTVLDADASRVPGSLRVRGRAHRLTLKRARSIDKHCSDQISKYGMEGNTEGGKASKERCWCAVLHLPHNGTLANAEIECLFDSSAMPRSPLLIHRT